MVSESGLSGIVLLPLIAMLVYAPLVHAAPPTMTLDGSAIGTLDTCSDNNCSASATLTTTNGNDVIVVVAQCGFALRCGGGNVTSVVDDGGHVWTLRAAEIPQQGRPIWEFYTVANSPLSLDRISVTVSGSSPSIGFIALGVSGANTRHPWDPSRSLPAAQTLNSGCTEFTTCTISFSAVAAEDFVIVSTAINDNGKCQDISPFQNIGNAIFSQAETDYFVTHIGGSNNISFTCSHSSPVTLLGDALRGPG